MSLEDRIRLPTLNLIHRRPRLIHKLENFINSGYRFITIYAPGGYGKSILLADFTQNTDLPVCWCSLESSDRDPTAFLTVLTHSISDRFHEIDAEQLSSLVEHGDTQNSVRQVGALLAEVGPHIIIIDDYHKAVSAGVTLALNQLLDQLPETSTIIVAARGDMGLETGQIIDLLITDRATGLSEEELRFTPEEVQLIMRKRFGRRIDLDIAGDIAQATDGNVAQILLTGHMMKADQNVGSLKQRLGDDHQIIYQYLAAEVFGKQSARLQNFMLCTSVLPDMTVEFCNELLDIANAQTYIEALVYNDLFVTQIGGGYRYHDLFAEFLRANLRKDNSLYHQITAKAADLLSVRSRFGDAIPLYLSIQAWDEGIELIEVHGKDFYNTGRVLTLYDWLEQIPVAELECRPRLQMLQGQVLNNALGKPGQALDLFRQAENQFQQSKDSISAAEAQINMSRVMRQMGHPKDALALATIGFEQFKKLQADKRLIAFALRNRGIAYHINGDAEAALSDLRTALELFEQLNDDYAVANCHQDIGVCLVSQGNISGADHHYAQALRTWESLGNASSLANTLNSFGVSLFAIGRYDEALQKLKQSLEIALQINSMRRAAFAQAGIADVYLETDNFEQAIEAYELSTEFARAASAASLEIYNAIKIGETHYRQGDLSNALQLAIQARDITTEAGLDFEKGLALTLQGKITVSQGQQNNAQALFAQAVTLFSKREVVEEVRTRLWWGYSLLKDCRPLAALPQLEESVSLMLDMGELTQSLTFTVNKTQELFEYFLHHSGTSTGLRNNIWLLLTQVFNREHPATPTFQIFSFGAPTLILAGERKQFSQRGGMSQASEFLMYLLLEGRHGGCSWGEISLAMWPELSRDKASIKFHQILRSIRRSILTEQKYILVQGDLYQINPDYLGWCDALAFDQLYDRLTHISPLDSLELQLELISLYQGEFLSGFGLGEWGESLRASYESRFLQVVKLASDQLLSRHSPQEALRIIQLGLAQDNYREDLHQNAFRAFAQASLYDSMIAHYDSLLQRFDRELNALPSFATQQLYQQLLHSR